MERDYAYSLENGHIPAGKTGKKQNIHMYSLQFVCNFNWTEKSAVQGVIISESVRSAEVRARLSDIKPLLSGPPLNSHPYQAASNRSPDMFYLHSQLSDYNFHGRLFVPNMHQSHLGECNCYVSLRPVRLQSEEARTSHSQDLARRFFACGFLARLDAASFPGSSLYLEKGMVYILFCFLH